MKKIYLVLAITFLMSTLFGFSSCSSDDDNDSKTIDPTELPILSKQFITDHFDGYKVARAEKKANSYDVALALGTAKSAANTGYDIEFDLQGNWIEIEAYNDQALPNNVLALLPRGIVSYVTQNYSGKGINEIKREDYGYKIELTGRPDVELLFDTQGAYLGNDNDEQVIGIDGLPASAKTFITTHFAGLTPQKVKKDGDNYDVKFTNNVELEFALTGDWKEIDANGTTLPQSVTALLPAKLTSYLSTNHASKRIEEIKVKVSSYEIELAGDINLVFDKTGEFWGSENNGNESGNGSRIEFSALPSSIQEVLNTHFLQSTKFLYAEKDSDEYEVKLANGTDIDFTLAGELKSIEVLPGNSVPEALVPSKILDYVKTNYQGKKIEEFEKKTSGYKVELSGYPEVELLFDSNGNFKGIDR